MEAGGLGDHRITVRQFFHSKSYSVCAGCWLLCTFGCRECVWSIFPTLVQNYLFTHLLIIAIECKCISSSCVLKCWEMLGYLCSPPFPCISMQTVQKSETSSNAKPVTGSFSTDGDEHRTTSSLPAEFRLLSSCLF